MSECRLKWWLLSFFSKSKKNKTKHCHSKVEKVLKSKIKWKLSNLLSIKWKLTLKDITQNFSVLHLSYMQFYFNYM